MELLESNDPKNELLKKSAQHRKELQNEVQSISARAQGTVKNAVVIGTSLALAYFVATRFSGTKKKKSKLKLSKANLPSADKDDVTRRTVQSPPSIISQVGTALMGQASAILLSLAKEKLTEFLRVQAAKKAH